MSRLRPALLGALLVLVAACGSGVPSAGGTDGARPSAGTAEPAATGAATAPATGAPAAPTAEPARTEEPAASEAPTASATPAASEEPTDPEEATDGLTGAEACSGSSDNRDFLLEFANRVEWPVLCAVLPRGWFVEGSYRLANGGKLLLDYKGPGGATIGLSQGAYCSADDDCVPHGASLGAAPLGPLDGTLYETDDGFGVIASPGENPGWLLTTEGLDRATTEEVAAALAEVER